MPYLGFGPAAYSFFENQRYGYSRDLCAYMDACRSLDFSAILQDVEHLSEEEIVEEKLLLGLRLNKGISLFDFPFDNKTDDYIKTLCQNGLAVVSDQTLSLTAKGMLLDNYITSELLLHLSYNE